MTIITTPATALTIANLLLRIRDMIGDISTNEANQRWSDTQIRRFIDLQLGQMWIEMTEQPTSFLESVTISYTADAESVALPAGFEGQAIYKVEDITNSSEPIFIDYMPQVDADRFPTKMGWFLQGLYLAIRPKPDAISVRVWRVKTFPRTSGANTTDQHALPIDHEELICLGTALKLLPLDDEANAPLLDQLNVLWSLFRRACARMRGPMYVRNARRFA